MHDLAHTSSACSVSQPDRRDNIRLRIRHRVGDGGAHVDLRRQVEDHLRSKLIDDLPQPLAPHISLHQLHIRVVAEVGGVAGTQIVDNSNIMAIADELVYEM